MNEVNNDRRKIAISNCRGRSKAVCSGVGYEIEVRAEQNPEPPAYFTRVEIKHRLRGCIDPGAVERAIHLSETKYCAVGAMISKTAKIETTFEILPDAAQETFREAA